MRHRITLRLRQAVAASVAGTTLLLGFAGHALASVPMTSIGLDITTPGLLTVQGTGNSFRVAGAATSANPTVSILGVDTDIGLDLNFKGAGGLALGTTTANADTLRLLPASGGGAAFTGTITSADLTATRNWTFPDQSGTFVVTAGTLSITGGKTFTASNTLTLNGTDGTVFTMPGATDTLVGLAATQTLSNKLLASPKISPVINDVFGNPLINFTAGGTANAFRMANTGSGFNPLLAVEGSDTDIGLDLTMKGAGTLNLGTTTANADTLNFLPAAGGGASFSGTLTSDDLTGARVWTLPDAGGEVTVLGNTATGTGGIVLSDAPTLTGDLTVDSPTFFVDSTNDRVGVGTVTPTTVLDVTGQTIDTQPNLTVAAQRVTANYIKNDANARNFAVVKLAPTFNFGGSNASTSVDILQISPTSSNLTGSTINAIAVGPIGSPVFSADLNGGVVATGAVQARGSLAVGLAGTPILRHQSGTATVGNGGGSIAAQTCITDTISVSFASSGDTVVATPPSTIEANLIWSAFVSGANTVTVRLCNPTSGGITSADLTWRADVWQH